MTIAGVINFACWSAAATLLVPCGILSAELVAALLATGRKSLLPNVDRPRMAVLIPAHNESAMIAHTVGSILPQLLPGDRLVVVADNCTDDTATLARNAGAEVIERCHATERGKGYALDFGVRHLEQNPPEIVVIADADIRIREGSIEALAHQVMATGRPAQAVYVLRPPADAGMKDQISHLAFTVRNHIRARGLTALVGASPLFGAGMAFPWHIIANAPLATGNIVEDLALGLDLAAAGHAPMLCEAARIDGTLVAMKTEADLKQRRRWEHGHMRTLLQHAPPVLLKGILNFRLRAIALALDVMIPPLSLMVMLLGIASFLLAMISLIPGVSVLPTVAVVLGMGVFGTLICVSWWRFAECEHPMRPLLAIPLYIARKIPLYISFVTRAEKNWNRAARPATAAAADALLSSSPLGDGPKPTGRQAA